MSRIGAVVVGWDLDLDCDRSVDPFSSLFRQEDINIQLDDDILTIAASRNEEHDESTTNFHVKERRFGRVQRSIRLPKSADHDSIRAQHENGTLRVCIDKKKEKQPSKQIDIASHDYRFAK